MTRNETINQTRIVGEYILPEAFGVARELEHAGISTEIINSQGRYCVSVGASDYERALRRI
jgi:hypothetical protein